MGVNDDKPSIAELIRRERAMTDGEWEIWTSNSFRRITAHGKQDGGVLSGILQRYDRQPDLDGNNRDADLAGIIALRNAAPLLLEIAAAGKAWAAQRADNLQSALMRTETELEAEAQDIGRARAKRTAELAAALEAALAKVGP